MSITKMAIEKNRVTIVLFLVLFFAGLSAYRSLPRAKDPGFIIRTAVIITAYPGASPERMENLVTDKLESMVQQIPELDYVNSESKTGVSVVYVNIKESYKDMSPIWDNLRRKVEDAKSDLPEGIYGPFVNDEFGDVFGIQITLTGEGYSYAELKEVADQVRDDLLFVDDVAKIDIYGTQEERLFIEYNNARLAQIGVSPGQLQQILQGQNILFPGGSISTGMERISLEPTGNIESVEDLRKTVINIPGQKSVLYLEDIADVYRGYVDPSTSFLRSLGEPALGIGVSMREGGNIIELGEAVNARMAYLEEQYPIGIEFETIYFSPHEVKTDIDNFITSLLQAVSIVMIVMIIFLGFRTGMIVTSLIPMTIMLTFLIMSNLGITLNMVSIASLIIALGMLVDNSIVMSESILVLKMSGKTTKEAAIISAKELRIPLLTASLITSSAFLPIFLAESNVGEYTADIFKVVAITLMCSWVIALTFIPMVAVTFIKLKKGTKAEAYDSKFYIYYRRFLLTVLKHPVQSIIVVVLLFIGGQQIGKLVPKIFFPDSSSPFMTAALEFPAGTSIDLTVAMIDDLESFMEDSLIVSESRPEGITTWSTFIGTAQPRFYLSANSNPATENTANLLVNTTSGEITPLMVARMGHFLEEKYPDLQANISSLANGPPVVEPIQIRISGENQKELFAIVETVKDHLRGVSGTKGVSDDWGRWSKKLVVDIDQPQAIRAGVSSYDVAVSLQTILTGINISQFREGDKLIPITLRADKADRNDINKLETLDVYSLATGRSVPLKQIADIDVVMEPSNVKRRDRKKTVMVKCFLEPGFNAISVFGQIEGWMNESQDKWPVGYRYEFGGELESSVKAQNSINDKLPIAFGLIVLLLVFQFNSIRKPLIILCAIPLATIGANVGLFITGSEMGFMSFLGTVALAGIVILNAVVLIDRIQIEMAAGIAPARAIVVAAQKRIRPILLTTATTVGGLIPLWMGGNPMWVSMSVTIIFGLLFATLLTLGVIPLLFSLFFKIKYKDFEY